jgi:glutaredoxin
MVDWRQRTASLPFRRSHDETKRNANTSSTDDGSAMQSTLGDMTGQTTVPNIFIGQQHIGGNSELQGKKKVKNLLKDAGAV